MTDHLAVSRRSFLRSGALGLGAAAAAPWLAACSSSGKTESVASSTSTVDEMQQLLIRARRDGKLNLIAVSDEPGSYYRPVLEGFRTLSKLDPTLITPGASSGGEIEAIREGKGRPTQPDVVDVGVAHAVEAQADGLFDPFLPEQWTDLPSAAKDPEGHWSATYFGLVGVVCNTAQLKGAKPPASLEDLQGLPDEVIVGMSGDPRSPKAAAFEGFSSNVAFATVWTIALANGGGLGDIGPGIEFLGDLAEQGTFDPSGTGLIELVAQGKLAATFLNNFEFAPARATARDDDPATELTFNLVDSESLFPNYNAQAITAKAPHRSAAQAWLWYLMSDEGARGFVEGGAIPTRFARLYAAGHISETEVNQLGIPGMSGEKLASVDFPTVDQILAAQKAVDERWGPEVLDRKR